MPELQEQARALGDPTRYKIFRYVTGAAGDVGVAELTDYLGLNHNAIRQHLAKLVDAGLLTETVAPAGGRGRPPLQYRTDPNAASRWGVEGPYQRLSMLLTEIVRTGASPEAVGREAGRAAAARSSATGVAALADLMARNGFAPETRRRGGTADVVLRTCPFAAAAANDPDTVCGLHLGMAHGIADVVDGLVIDGLKRKDPHKANCRLHCHLESS